MPMYITLLRWTAKGIENVKQSPARLEAGRQAFRAMGVDLKSFYMTMGRYDMVTIVEAPNDEAAAKALLNLSSQGSVQTETLRAFTEEEYRKIISGLS